MNIDNMTQKEIEQLFSNESVKEMLMADLDILLNTVTEDFLNVIEHNVGVDKLDDVSLLVLTILGNPKMGYESEYEDNRHINPEDFVKTLGKRLGDYQLAMNILVQLDGVMLNDTVMIYELKDKVIKDEFGNFATHDYIDITWSVEEDVLLAPTYNRFKLPMIEEPNEWTTEFTGGYHLSNDKVTLNKGEAKQPQEVLDVLNKLQSNAYTLRSTVNAQEEHAYNIDKLTYKRGKDNLFIQKDALAMVLTAQETYDTMKDKEFYFEWKYDFRGRINTTGYDINLQASSYKKSCLKPILKEI